MIGVVNDVEMRRDGRRLLISTTWRALYLAKWLPSPINSNTAEVIASYRMQRMNNLSRMQDFF